MPPPVYMHPGMHTPSDEGTPPIVDAALVDATPSYEGALPVVDATPQYTCILICTPLPPIPIKIGNPTSQCALLG